MLTKELMTEILMERYTGRDMGSRLKKDRFIALRSEERRVGKEC